MGLSNFEKEKSNILLLGIDGFIWAIITSNLGYNVYQCVYCLFLRIAILVYVFAHSRSTWVNPRWKIYMHELTHVENAPAWVNTRSVILKGTSKNICEKSNYFFFLFFFSFFQLYHMCLVSSLLCWLVLCTYYVVVVVWVFLIEYDVTFFSFSYFGVRDFEAFMLVWSRVLNLQ